MWCKAVTITTAGMQRRYRGTGLVIDGSGIPLCVEIAEGFNSADLYREWVGFKVTPLFALLTV